MKTGSIISYILAAIAIILSFLFILGSFSPNGSPSWLVIGIIGLLIGFALIFAGVRLAAQAKKEGDTIYNVNLDLPGNVQMDTMKCLSCGAPLSPEDIQMVNGAPVVTCPNCGTTYQLTEEPKW
ncbi:MAG: hypothetical protein PHW11_04955 [Anaerolineaceae bacterium]|jgi:uncharacterized membrane protein|nr:hypothetical protein [Anaerolineaceae bacterium]MDD4042077.1 hypothetical protein [Anaerolineaceae bacterium]MDD4578098.1 hypothetical protein [Anaerolineaceae bacterium]